MKVQLLNDKCTPVKKHKTDAGWDLVAAESCHVSFNQPRRVSAGIKVAIPEGYVGLIAPRSGLGISGVNLANTIGFIDADYRGEVLVYIKNTNKISKTITEGERFAQMVVIPVNLEAIEIVDSLDETLRGEGGFGSTGTFSTEEYKAPSLASLSESAKELKKISIKEKMRLAKEKKCAK